MRRPRDAARNCPACRASAQVEGDRVGSAVARNFADRPPKPIPLPKIRAPEGLRSTARRSLPRFDAISGNIIALQAILNNAASWIAQIEHWIVIIVSKMSADDGIDTGAFSYRE